MTPLPIRSVGPDEYAALRRVIEHAFGEGLDEEVAAREKEVIEFDRTLAAFDGDEIVASTAAYSFDMTVPGGSVPAAGVTWVSVLPTHRRRGLLTALMRRQLDDIHDSGREPIATLWASEPPIYGRFGYGMAAPAVRLTLPRKADSLRLVPGTAELRLRLVEPEESVSLVLPVYDHDRGRRPGMFALNETWQQLRIFLGPSERDGASPLRTVLAEDASGVRSYARYVVKASWRDGAADSTVVVREVHGRDSVAVAAIWGFLLDLDLTTHVGARLRPTDDPVLSLLNNVRSAAATVGDGLYVRLMDVGAALSARTFSAPADVVVDVRDDFCPWNAGRWRISGDPTGAACERSNATPNLSLDVRDLGAAYLGGPSISTLAEAGLVTEHSPGAVRELSSALRHEPAPWCPLVF